MQPEFDIEHKEWFVKVNGNIVVAKTLRELSKQLGPNCKIEDYYPNGWRGKIEYPAESVRKAVPITIRDWRQNVKTAKPVKEKQKPRFRPPRKKMLNDSSIRARTYDHEAIMDMWASGMTGPQIGDKLGMRNWTYVASVVTKYRKHGDIRAESRTSNPRWR